VTGLCVFPLSGSAGASLLLYKLLHPGQAGVEGFGMLRALVKTRKNKSNADAWRAEFGFASIRRWPKKVRQVRRKREEEGRRSCF
jgi:hypothetical protein